MASEYEVTIKCPSCLEETIVDLEEGEGYHNTFCTWCGKKCRYKV